MSETEIISTIDGIHDYVRKLRSSGKTIALVPTMGYLHEGHISLVKRGSDLCDSVIVSDFVNPSQFAPEEDFSTYPRDFDRDRKLLEENGVAAIFHPSKDEMYPQGCQTFVEVTEITKKLEGQFRPIHFRGVTTVVSMLFNAVRPDVALFGRKDAQQAAVIKKMVRDLHYDIRVEICPIVREADGLAKSSRNIYLTPKERGEALILRKSLLEAKELVLKGESNTCVIVDFVRAKVGTLAAAKMDYVSIVEEESFEDAGRIEPYRNYYLLIACKIGPVRLIDNCILRVE